MRRLLILAALLFAPFIQAQTTSFKESTPKKSGDFGTAVLGVYRDTPSCDPTESYCPLQLDTDGRLWTDIGKAAVLKNDSYATNTSKGMLAMFRTISGRPSPGTCNPGAYCPGQTAPYGGLHVITNQIPPTSIASGVIDDTSDNVIGEGVSPVSFITMMLDASVVPGGFDGDLVISTSGFNGVTHPAWIYDANGVLITSVGELNYSTDQFNDYLIFAPPGTETVSVHATTVNSGEVQVNLSRSYDASPFVMRGPGWEALDDIASNLGPLAQESTLQNVASAVGTNGQNDGPIALPLFRIGGYDEDNSAWKALRISGNQGLKVYDNTLYVALSNFIQTVDNAPTGQGVGVIGGVDTDANRVRWLRLGTGGEAYVVPGTGWSATGLSTEASLLSALTKLDTIITKLNATLAVTQSGTWTVTGAGGTFPVTGTFWQATQPVSIASMPSTPVTGTFWPTTAAAPSAGRLSTGSAFYNALSDTELRATPVPVSGTGLGVTGTFWPTAANAPASVRGGDGTNFYSATNPGPVANQGLSLTTGQATLTSSGDGTVVSSTANGWRVFRVECGNVSATIDNNLTLKFGSTTIGTKPTLAKYGIAVWNWGDNYVPTGNNNAIIVNLSAGSADIRCTASYTAN